MRTRSNWSRTVKKVPSPALPSTMCRCKSGCSNKDISGQAVLSLPTMVNKRQDPFERTPSIGEQSLNDQGGGYVNCVSPIYPAPDNSSARPHTGAAASLTVSLSHFSRNRPYRADH